MALVSDIGAAVERPPALISDIGAAVEHPPARNSDIGEAVERKTALNSDIGPAVERPPSRDRPACPAVERPSAEIAASRPFPSANITKIVLPGKKSPQKPPEFKYISQLRIKKCLKIYSPT